MDEAFPTALKDQTGHVLVVEDDEDIAQLIALQLRRAGFEALTTAYGEEAVSLAQTRNVDLITRPENSSDVRRVGAACDTRSSSPAGGVRCGWPKHRRSGAVRLIRRHRPAVSHAYHGHRAVVCGLVRVAGAR